MLFTFPSRYWYAIGLTRVFSLAGWARRIRAGLHVSRVTQDTTDWHVRTSKGLSPAMAGLSRPFLLSHTMTLCGPTTPQRRRHNCGLGSSPVARHSDGLSHSEIRASQDMCSYTRLIAAYHVLRRLREPRHPSCALSYFLSLCPHIRMQYISLYMHRERRGCILSASSFVCLQVCQYVKYRPENLAVFTKRWRITDSNR